jgi:hypothetical protein
MVPHTRHTRHATHGTHGTSTNKWCRGTGSVTNGTSVQKLLAGSSLIPPLAGIPEFAVWAQDKFGPAAITFDPAFSRTLLNGILFLHYFFVPVSILISISFFLIFVIIIIIILYLVNYYLF